MVRYKSHNIRTSPRFRRLINLIRAKYIMDGKKPPSSSKITEAIAKKLQKNGDGEFINEFIRL